jgi:hypothetical protein
LRIRGKYFFEIVSQRSTAFSRVKKIGCFILVLYLHDYIFISYGQDVEHVPPETSPLENIETPQIVEAAISSGIASSDARSVASTYSYARASKTS